MYFPEVEFIKDQYYIDLNEEYQAAYDSFFIEIYVLETYRTGCFNRRVWCNL